MGCNDLDNLLNGGYPIGMITELFGESGTGKTQICLQLALHTQLPPAFGGMFGSSIYMHSNNVFPTTRLQQLMNALVTKCDNGQTYLSLDNVIVKRVDESSQLLSALEGVEILCQQASASVRNVRVIIIDSIASIFEANFANNSRDMTTRSNLFFKVSAKLKALANTYNIAVVITKDTRDVFNDARYTTNNMDLKASDNRRVQPALGLAWSNCISNRLYVGMKIVNGNKLRYLNVVFSPYLPCGTAHFTITSLGVENVAE